MHLVYRAKNKDAHWKIARLFLPWAVREKL
jgi:hypothetical protein